MIREETSIFVSLAYGTGILNMVINNCLKTQNIRFKLFSFDSICSIPQDNSKTCIYRWKINLYPQRDFDFLASRLRNTIFWIWLIIILWKHNIFTQHIRFKLASFDSIWSTLQVNIKNMYLSLKNNLLLSKKHRFTCL